MILYIALCDNEREVLRTEAQLICDIFDEKEIQYKLQTFSSPKELLETEIIYDIVFLDVEMPELSGIELAKKIEERKKNCLVFFLTSYSFYLDNAFDVNALRYLIKPVDKNRLSLGIDSALQRINSRNKTILVTGYKNRLSVRLSVGSIIYIENIGRHTHIVSKERDFIASELFSVIKNKIEQQVNYFAASHQSYFINLNYVTEYSKKDVKMSYAGRTYVADMSRRKFQPFDKKMFMSAKHL
ncbi:MAG: response regulator transcription factor [Clostridia bacterium]|nr:response regulator transcription factor [Clostridia bacterium]